MSAATGSVSKQSNSHTQQNWPARLSGLVDRYAILTLIVAACSLLYELIIAQTLSLLAANTVVWYSLVVGFFLLGMGAGAALNARIFAKAEPWAKLIWIELMLSSLGAVSVPFLHCLHAIFLQQYANDSGLLALYVFFAIAMSISLTIGLLSGFELPILIQVAKTRHRQTSVSTILAWDYLGSLLGALSFPLLLLPALELHSIAILTAALNLSIAVWLNLRRLSSGGMNWLTQLLVALMLVLGLSHSWIQKKDLQQLMLQQYYYYLEKSDSLWNAFSLSNDYPEIQRSSSAYQKIDVFQDLAVEIDDILIQAFSDKLKNEPDYPKDLMLFLNGDFQINTNFDEIYHEYFAHLPISMRGKIPQKVLVLGGGDGLLLHELLKYDSIEIFHVDLDRELIRVASEHPLLSRANRNSLNDRRVTRQFADGFQFVRRSKQTYDAIYIDFPAAVDYNLAKLYSREFFAFVRQRLAPDGFAVFDATGIGLLSLPDAHGQQQLEEDNSWQLYYHTLKAAGFVQIEPYITTLELDNPAILKVLADSGNQLPIDPEMAALLTKVSDADSRKDLLQAYLSKIAESLSAEFVLGLQQGFIALSNTPNLLKRDFTPLPVSTYILDRNRFNLAFSVNFPQVEKIDWEKVNSILRPTFPDQPAWQPRIPF